MIMFLAISLMILTGLMGVYIFCAMEGVVRVIMLGVLGVVVCLEGSTLVDSLPFVARTVTVGEQATILHFAGKDPVLLAQSKAWILSHKRASLNDLLGEADTLQHLKNAEFVKKTLGAK